MLVKGNALVLNCDGYREVLVVNPIGCETEADVCNKAFLAARNGYPTGTIDILEVRPNQGWHVYGLQADVAGECFWQSDAIPQRI